MAAHVVYRNLYRLGRRLPPLICRCDHHFVPSQTTLSQMQELAKLMAQMTPLLSDAQLKKLMGTTFDLLVDESKFLDD